jgi:indole-3-acetate monooxygenase
VEISSLHHAAVIAPDLEAAQAFYGDLLGLRRRADRPDNGRPGLWFDAGDQQIHIILPGGPPQHFALRVANIDAAVGHLRAHGVEVPDPYGIGGLPRREGEAVQTILVDPFGNRIEIIQLVEYRTGGEVRAAVDQLAQADDIAAWTDASEKRGRLVPALLDALHDSRMFRLLLPTWLGGSQLHPATFVDAMEGLAAVDASTAWCVCQALGCSVSAAYLTPPVATEVFGPDRSVLAWGVDVGSQAVAVDGGYRLTGSWSYVSGIHHASWLGGDSRVVHDDGTPHLTPTGGPETLTLLFPVSAATIREVWNAVGLRATGTDSFSVSDLFVPQQYTLAREQPSRRQDWAPLYAFTHAAIFSSGFAGVALGIGRATLRRLEALAATKTPFRQGRALRDSPVVQAQIAVCEARLGAAESYLHSEVNDAWQETAGGHELSGRARTAIRLATSHAFSEAAAVTEIAYHAAGIDAVVVGRGFERPMRDMRTATQQFQGRDDHYEAVGRAILDGLVT